MDKATTTDTKGMVSDMSAIFGAKTGRRTWLVAALAVLIVAALAGTALAAGNGFGGKSGSGGGKSGVAAGSGGYGSGGGMGTAEGVGTRGGGGTGGGGSGTCDECTGVVVSDVALSDAEIADLLFMREEEKVARDLYNALYEQWDVRVFANIARSEQKHMDAVKTLLDAYGIQDPVGVDAPGVFENDELQALYDELLAQGSGSVEQALAVGVLVEETDIADLQAALQNTDNPSISKVYENLLMGSENHLKAFSRDR